MGLPTSSRLHSLGFRFRAKQMMIAGRSQVLQATGSALPVGHQAWPRSAPCTHHLASVLSCTLHSATWTLYSAQRRTTERHAGQGDGEQHGHADAQVVPGGRIVPRPDGSMALGARKEGSAQHKGAVAILAV